MPSSMYVSRRRRGALLALLLTLLPLALTALPTVGASATSAQGLGGCPAIIHQAGSVSWSAIAWKSCFPGTITQSSPTVTSYRAQTLVAVGDESGAVHLLDAATGRELPGWPVSMAVAGGQHAAIEGSPTFAYLNGPSGPPSIIVGAGSTWVTNTAGEVEAFSLTGARRWIFHVGRVVGTATGVISTPAAGDILGNGGTQIVFGSWDHKIYLLDARGHQIGFAYDNADTIWSSPALYRLPGRRAADIYIGSDASGRTDATLPGGRCSGGYLTDFRWSLAAVDPDTRNVGPGLTRVWYKCLNQAIWSSPAVGIINTTHRAAVVVGTGFYDQPFPSDTNHVFAYYAATGTIVPGWPATTVGPAIGSPSIGVLGNGTTPSVIETAWLCTGATQSTCIASNHSVVEAFHGNGKLQWKTRLLGPTVEGSAVLTPLRNESGNDLLVGTSYGLYPLNGDNGHYLFGTNGSNQWATINPACRIFSTPAIAQVASGWEAITSCGGPPQFHFPGEVAAFPLPVQPTLTSPGWPMFRLNSSHSASTAS